MNKIEWLKVINDRQDLYVEELISLILNSNSLKKEINFNSPTGTGKTRMMAKLINKFDENKYYFLITSLSRGGLNKQIQESIKKNVKKNNYNVFGVSSYTKNTKIQKNEILNLLPNNKKLIWIRDEGHIKSNNWMKILEKLSFKIINLSATNKQIDIQCNFTDTPMLRTPIQKYGTPEEAINKLIEIKYLHRFIKNYNPCLIVRDINETYTEIFIKLCKKNNLKYINITDNDVNIQQLCENNNEYDVIINKMKITEGIDIPRANVIFIGNKPYNESTLIQLIGRVRRNALLWLESVDIFNKENKNLLEQTSKSYIYYNSNSIYVNSNNDNELCMELSDSISVESLLPDSVYVENNRLENGYRISELSLLTKEYTGKLLLTHDNDFVQIKNLESIYKTKTKLINKFFTKYKEIICDKELVSISFDKSKFVRINDVGRWCVATSVSDNISYGKLYRFLTAKYREELNQIELLKSKPCHIFDIEGNQRFKHCINSIEKYLIKFFLFGEKYIQPFYDISHKRFSNITNDNYNDKDIVFYACGLAYKEHMKYFFGDIIKNLIPCLSIQEIINIKNTLKIDIWEKAKTIAKVLDKLLFDKDIHNQRDMILCPYFGNSKILHGIVDIVTKEKLVLLVNDSLLKKEHILKLLAIHYLSTKRYDLTIKSLIIYDFNSNLFEEIFIKEKNLTTLKYVEPIKSDCSFDYLNNDEFNLNHINFFYNNYGKEYTLKCLFTKIKELSTSLSYRLDNNKKMSQKKLLRTLFEINDFDLFSKVANIMKPSKQLLIYALRINNTTIVNSLLKKVKPDSEILLETIKNKNIDLLKVLLKKIKIQNNHFKEAIKSNNIDIQNTVIDNIHFTKYMANDVINSENLRAIEKLLKTYKPNMYNFIVAIKTQNIDVIKLIYKKIDKVTLRCLEVAKATNNPEITNLLMEYLKNKNV